MTQGVVISESLIVHKGPTINVNIGSGNGWGDKTITWTNVNQDRWPHTELMLYAVE